MNESVMNKLASYRPSEEAISLIKNTPILLLVGPTGAGKDSLKQKLLETGRYHHIISHTTRPPRINHGVLEQDGREYHFIDIETAEKMIDEQEFVEAKLVHGVNIYGTSVAEIKASNDESRVAVTDIEVQGVAEYKALDTNVVAVFLLPPNFEMWHDRLQRRYGDTVNLDDQRQRFKTALDELEQLMTTDNYIPVINDNLDEVVEEVEQILAAHVDTPERESKARALAEQLMASIKAHLESTNSNPQ